MSLLDGLLRDALLQTVMQQDVYVAIRTDASSSATQPIGSGTWDDPYGGTSDNAAWFDYMMSHNVQANQTVRLGPGTFPTTGNSADGVYAGWAPVNGVRILGSGMGVTMLQLVDIPDNATRYAVGINFGATSLSGFELSDLTIDCNLPSDAAYETTAGAIRVRGSNVYLRRIKVINYGTAGGGPFSVITAAGESSENCVIEECMADIPASAHGDGGIATIFAFEGTSNGHRFCSVRNCAARGLTQIDPPPVVTAISVKGISPGIGLGTVIEGNQIANCASGIESTALAKDIVIWNNYLRNVSKGIYFQNNSSTTAVGRVIAIDNVIELATVSGSLSDPVGIRLTTSQTSTRFTQVTIRKNLVRDVQVPLEPTNPMTGIDLAYCGEAIVENNIISDTETDDGVRFGNCPAIKFFNNETPAGELLRGYDTSASKYVLELEDAVEDVLLPL